MLRFLTAGESHGPQLTVIMDGVPAGFSVNPQGIDRDLRRRQGGYGRGGRMSIENDQVQIVSGVRRGLTLGSPIALVVANRDWENWRGVMAVEADAPVDPADHQEGEGVAAITDPRVGARGAPVTAPRPGHADLAGALKYGHHDVRNVLERSSARETVSRVAAGGVAKQLLSPFGVEIHGAVRAIGGVEATWPEEVDWEAVEASPVRCPDAGAARLMVEAIDEATAAGDTLGGTVSVVASGVPLGLGSYVHWDRRLDGRLAQALMSINSVKAVELGAALEQSRSRGSVAHDAIAYEPGRGFVHLSNRSGGLTGGVTNGEPVWASAVMKPLSTLRKPAMSVDMESKQRHQATYERSDVSVVPAGAVIAEAMVALVLADAFLEKFGGDSLEETRHNLEGYLERVRAR
jgi:chorismate synthase